MNHYKSKNTNFLYFLILSLQTLSVLSTYCTGQYFGTCGEITITSVNHAGGCNGCYANYYTADITAIYGDQSWVNQDVYVFVPRLGNAIKTILWGNPNGGSVGDGHSRPNGDSRYSASSGLYRTGDKFQFNIPITCIGNNRDAGSKLCACSQGYFQVSEQNDCGQCNRKCQTCSQVSENCDTCKGANRKLPLCECEVGYYDDGVNEDCQPCDYKCSQCSYYPNEYQLLMDTSSMIYSTPEDLPNETNPFGQTGGVIKVTGMVRFGRDAVNNIPLLHYGTTYQFCVWVKFITYNTGDSFQLDIWDRASLKYITDKDGLLKKAMGGSGNISTYIPQNEWTRVCVNAKHDNNSQYNFIDLGDHSSGKIYYMYGHTLSQIPSVSSEPLPYVKSYSDLNDGQCQYCAHYSRTGANCACSPGYYEVSEGSIECHSPKPDECEKYIRIESSGLMISNPDTNSDYAHFYLNDQALGSATDRGFNFIKLDNDYNFSEQKVFDVLGNAAEVTNMINYINALPDGTVVLVAINDEASGNMTTAGYQALQSIGLNQYTTFNYRDAFAMIGKKGAAPGTVKQVVGRLVNKGRANLVGCLKCSASCFSCVDEFNQYPILEDIFTWGNPVLNESLTDFKGETGSVKEVIGSNGGSFLRFGKFQINDKPVDQIFKGKIYQFSLWIKLKPGQTQNGFQFDIVDRTTVRYLSDENGSILKMLDTEHPLDDNVLTEQWQRIVVNAVHDNADFYHFIDVGQASNLINFEISHPQLFEIPDINYPPIRHVQPNQPQTGCYKCLHYARIPPVCECSTGYSETVSGETECSSPIPDTCSKYIRIESAGTNYGQYDTGDYLRIYMNDVSYGTFTRGITIIVLNADTLGKESQNTFDSGDASFDPTSLISHINGISSGKKVLVGIRDDGSQNLSTGVYTALQTLGMNSNTQINYRDGFAMIGTKGSNPGTANEQIGILLKGSKANTVQCLLGCDHQCATCSNEPDSCDSCSHTTRDILNSCACKDTYYNSGTNVQCESCNSPCLKCSSNVDCTSCVDGYYLSGNRCLPCDNTKCSTCVGQADNCILSCNNDCKTCLVNQICDSCNDGTFLNTGACPNCDNSKCATCHTDNQTCTLQCRATCATCNVDASCLSCVPQKFVNSDGDCQICDKTQCATCSGSADSCLNTCNSECKTCISDKTCDSCVDGKYLNNGTCSNCDNSKCATCHTDNQTCTLSCRATCATCNVDASCLSCVPQKFVNSDGDCQICDKTQCATCSGSADSCLTTCNSDCKTCISDKTCDSCVDGKYLSNGTCPNCDNSKCATCHTDNQTCTLSCRATCATCNVDASCLSCVPQKFVNSDGDCQICDKTQCATCSGSADSCLTTCNSECKTCISDKTCDSCVDGKYLNNGTCSNCDNSKCATCHTNDQTCNLPCRITCKTCNVNAECINCEDGKYLQDSDKTCQPCDNTKCGTCTDFNDECIQQCNETCATCNTSGHCISCPDGFFLDGNVCTQCDYTVCATCVTNATTCILNCDSSCETCNIEGKCLSCIDSQFVDLTQGQLCKICDYTCSKCQNSADNCLECNDEFRSENRNCLCDEGYFDQNNQNPVCLECEIQCGTCKNEADNCLTCIDDSRSNPPECSCASKFYQDNETGECLHCKGDCNCNDTGVCIECLGSTLELRVLPSCNCQTGYFQNQNGDCKKCAYNCKTCVEKADNCQICQTGINRSLITPSCSCLDGYYQNEQELKCEECYFGCLTCSSYNVCTGDRCRVSEFELPLCQSSSIQIGFSVVINQGQQNQEVVQGVCENQCASCENQPQQCTSCIVGLNRQNDLPNCLCKPGYHDNEKTTRDCFKCSKNCQTCTQYSKCSSCDEHLNRHLNGITMQCECQIGYISENNTENSVCIPCYNYRGECFKQCPKNTLQDDQLRICQDFIQKKSSNNSILYLCLLSFLVIYIIMMVILKFYSNKKLNLISNQQQYQNPQKVNKSNISDIQQQQDDKQSISEENL